MGLIVPLTGAYVINHHRYFVFDLDGTVLSSTPFYHAILETIFHRNGISLTEDDKRLAMGLSASAFLAPRLNPEAMEEALIHLRDQSQVDKDFIPVFDGLHEVLAMIHGRGDRLAIWTSREKTSALQLVEKQKIAQFFDLVVTADCVRRHKPDPEGLTYIASQFGCDFSDIVMIGDHDVDILAAKATGSLPVRANWHGYRPGENCHLGALTVHSVAELSTLLRR